MMHEVAHAWCQLLGVKLLGGCSSAPTAATYQKNTTDFAMARRPIYESRGFFWVGAAVGEKFEVYGSCQI